MGWEAQISLEDGLKDAYSWFLKHHVNSTEKD
jgi:nucleoside-diphosphate-sugar epimerase